MTTVITNYSLDTKKRCCMVAKLQMVLFALITLVTVYNYPALI